ncbi:hypothetical protein [Streptosporangium jomthongense]|uniref:Hedgehog/Intein (Hint) domain-containing protein n=1 Tax=Streptosporangium jomthongense TaxID=1193683 RepID=A0ABV8F9P6_9ACTN
MTNRFVTAQLFRVGHLPTVERRGVAIPRQGTSALMVTSVRETHVMLLTPGRGTLRRGTPRGTRIFDGTHVVARLDERADQDWYEVADVLVTPQPGREILGRYPGCEVAVGARPPGCLAALRDGRLVTIAGSARPALCGSFLYGWRAAGMPLDALTTDSVFFGRYVGRIEALETTRRACVRTGEEAA